MSQFNAGSIMATLDLNRDPFSAGLDEAKRQKDEFAEDKATATVTLDDTDADAKLDDLKVKLDEVGDDTAHVGVDVDDTRAKLELDELALKIEDIKHTRLVIDVQRGDISSLISDTNALLASVDQIAPAADAAIGKGGPIGGGGEEGEGISGMMGLIAVALALSPALIPIGASALAVFGALGLGATMAGISLGSFAAVAKSDFTEMTTRVTALATAQKAVASAKTIAEKVAALKQLKTAEEGLKGPIGEAAKAYMGLEKVWDKVKHETAGPVFHVITDALRVASKLLPDIVPLVDATAKALGHSVRDLGRFLGSSQVQGFLTLIENSVGPDLSMITRTVINFMKGLLNLAPGFNGTLTGVLKTFLRWSKSFEEWTASKAGREDMQKFFDYVKQNGPAVASFFGSIGGDIGKFISAMSKPGSQLLPDITKFLQSLPGLLPGVMQVEGYFVKLMDAFAKISPVLGPIGKLVAWLFKVASVAQGLEIAEAIPKFIAKLKSSFDTGVEYAERFVGDMQTAWGAVTTAFGAVEGFIDIAINKIVGYFEKVKHWLDTVLHVAVNGLKTAWHSAWSGISGAVSTAWGIISGIFAKIESGVSRLTGPIGKVIGWGEKLLGGSPSLPKYGPGHAVGGATSYSNPWTLVGENGPELAQLPGGTHVYGNSTTAQMLGAGGGPSLIDSINNQTSVLAALLEALAENTGNAVGSALGDVLTQSSRQAIAFARAG